MDGLSPLVYGFGVADPSDWRDNEDKDSRTGSGTGSAPTPGDGRMNQDANPAAVEVYDMGNNYARISPLLADADTWPNDPSDTRGRDDRDAPHGSGAQDGSPAFEYDGIRLGGSKHEMNGPLDGGLNDPIRRGMNPARRAVTRHFFNREAWAFWTPADFGRDRDIVGADFRGAQQPAGRMNPMDEYRLLSDGVHA